MVIDGREMFESMIVRDERANRFLWTLRAAVDGGYLCSSRSLTEADLGLIEAGEMDIGALSDKTPYAGVFSKLDGVFDFFAGHGDTDLAAHAAKLLRGFDPKRYS